MLYALLLIPLLWPFIAKAIWKNEITPKELGLNIGIVVVMVLVLWFAGTSSQTKDTEIWNGQITAKNRIEDSHRESYSCNCRTVTRYSNGKSYSDRKCDTCWRTRYTVDWKIQSTIGNFSAGSVNSLNRSVWHTPNPHRFDVVIIGEPCSRENSYDNYVKAVPETLFRVGADKQYTKMVPAYPKVYDMYRVNRVLNVGSGLSATSIKQLNDGTSMMLRTLGPAKQVNIILIVTNIKDPSYRFAVESAWLGAKKNDAVIFLGLDGNNIVWADAMTFAKNKGNELFQVTMRDSLQDLKTFDVSRVLSVIEAGVSSKYDRIQMKNFEYLKDDITPPTWLIILTIVLSMVGTGVLSFVFAHNNEHSW